MEYYNQEIAENPQVELIWYPREDEDSAESWAAASKFPWPTIRERAFEKVEPISKHYANSVPGYFLVDAEGKLLATGLYDARREISKLKGS